MRTCLFTHDVAKGDKRYLVARREDLIGRLQRRLDDRHAAYKEAERLWLEARDHAAIAAADAQRTAAYEKLERTRKTLIRVEEGRPYWVLVAEWPAGR